jgi:alanine or glycine:cation symporter, AGCS family
MALTQAAMNALVGDWGASFMAIALLFFAFTSIMANTYYGETSLAFIHPGRKLLMTYRLVVLVGDLRRLATGPAAHLGPWPTCRWLS